LAIGSEPEPGEVPRWCTVGVLFLLLGLLGETAGLGLLEEVLGVLQLVCISQHGSAEALLAVSDPGREPARWTDDVLLLVDGLRLWLEADLDVEP
jgi:hypothetical protein